MLRYFDRRGTQISRDRWWQLFNCPKGDFQLAKATVAGRDVGVFWLGVAPTWERVPLIFVVENRPSPQGMSKFRRTEAA